MPKKESKYRKNKPFEDSNKMFLLGVAQVLRNHFRGGGGGRVLQLATIFKGSSQLLRKGTVWRFFYLALQFKATILDQLKEKILKIDEFEQKSE